jgi:hypothetical protein
MKSFSKFVFSTLILTVSSSFAENDEKEQLSIYPGKDLMVMQSWS